MRLSNSKKELARIISENGGWREGADTCSRDNDGYVNFFVGKPTRNGRSWLDNGDCEYIGGIITPKYEKIKNWHQTILSRTEYFHLYPAPVEVVVENKTTCHLAVTDKPTIEQLAADYRNAKDYAERKQQEADAAKVEAGARLAALVAAGKEFGLVLSVAAPEPELVITDWRDLRPGDEVEYVEGSQKWSIGLVGVVQRTDDDNGGNMNVRLLFGEGGAGWPRKWRFIRRP